MSGRSLASVRRPRRQPALPTLKLLPRGLPRPRQRHRILSPGVWLTFGINFEELYVATWHDSATGCSQAKGTLGRVESGRIIILEPTVFSLVSYGCFRLHFVHEAVFPLAFCTKRCFRLYFVHAAVCPLFFLFMLAAWPLSFSFLLDCAKRCVRYIYTYIYICISKNILSITHRLLFDKVIANLSCLLLSCGLQANWQDVWNIYANVLIFNAMTSIPSI